MSLLKKLNSLATLSKEKAKNLGEKSPSSSLSPITQQISNLNQIPLSMENIKLKESSQNTAVLTATTSSTTSSSTTTSAIAAATNTVSSNHIITASTTHIAADIQSNVNNTQKTPKLQIIDFDIDRTLGNLSSSFIGCNP